ncbi:hypothetical protein GCK32_000082 [Trichostrongylus colubriformis]|uniref:Uncharacterized protein n=1 Tax=Trichostrongylus colubriformis TaxID=6319 RepID=A0AAN8ING5_TRICO
MSSQCGMNEPTFPAMSEDLREIGKPDDLRGQLGLLIHALRFHAPCMTIPEAPGGTRNCPRGCIRTLTIWTHLHRCNNCEVPMYVNALKLVNHWIDCHCDSCFVCGPWCKPTDLGHNGYRFLKEVTGYYYYFEPKKSQFDKMFADRIALQFKAPHHYNVDAAPNGDADPIKDAEVQTVFTQLNKPLGYDLEAQNTVHIATTRNKPSSGCAVFVVAELGGPDGKTPRRHCSVQVDTLPRTCNSGQCQCECDDEESTRTVTVKKRGRGRKNLRLYLEPKK